MSRLTLERRWLVAGGIGLILIIGASSLTVTAFRIAHSVSTKRAEAQIGTQATQLTLQQAWDLFAAEAQRWHQGAQIVQLTSSNTGSDTPSAGMDGRRLSWLATIATTDTKSTLRLHSLGSVIDHQEAGPGVGQRPALRKPQIDSPAALISAQAAKPGLTAAREKSLGYQFSLRAGPPNVVTVGGYLGGVPTSIDVDADSGVAAGTSTYSADSTGGILYSPDGGQTWQASTLVGVTVTSLAIDRARPRTAWATVAQPSGISVYQSTDGGRTWAHAGDLPNAAGSWAYRMTAATQNAAMHLAVGTAQGVWLSTDGAASWTKMAGLPDGPAQFLAFASTSSGLILHVSVAAGPNAAHYASTDLRSWQRLGNAGRLSQLDDQATAVNIEQPAVPGNAPVAATVHRITAQASLSLPTHVLRLAGDSSATGVLLAGGPDGIHRSLDGGKSWSQTLNASLGGLNTAPDFSRSGVAVAGGFRSGIYRSGDGGRTWMNVLPHPEAVARGNNEVGAVAFTSASDVIALQGGTASWKAMGK